MSPADGGPPSCPGNSVEYGTQRGYVGTETVVVPPAETGADPAPDPESVPEVPEIPVPQLTVFPVSVHSPEPPPVPVPSKAGCAQTAVGRWSVELTHLHANKERLFRLEGRMATLSGLYWGQGFLDRTRHPVGASDIRRPSPSYP